VSSEGERWLRQSMNAPTLGFGMKRGQRIYLDVCCVSRPFDDQGQLRVHLETVAVESILLQAHRAECFWVGSDALMYEAANLTDMDRRARIGELLEGVREWVRVGSKERDRVVALMEMGFKPLDALHVACGETGKVDALLTTDDRLLKLAVRRAALLRVRVVNPLRWMEEQMR